MPIDAGIFQNFLRPPKTVQEYDADAIQAKGNALGLQQQSLQLNALQRQQADDLAYREAAKGFGSDASANANLLFQRGLPAQAMAIQKAGLEANQVKARTAKESSVAEKNEWDLRVEKANKAISDIAGLSSPEQAIESLNQNLRAGNIDQQKYQAVLGTIPQDPAQFPAWRKNMLVNILDAKTQLELTKPTIQTRNTGGSTDTLAIDPMTGKVTVTNSVRNTMSPDAVASNKVAQGQLDVARQRLAHDQSKDAKEASTGVTYQQDAQGNLVALPKNVAPGQPVSPIPVMAGGAPMQGKNSPKAAFAQQYSQVKGVLEDVKALIPKATSSGVGKLRDVTLGAVGATTDAGNAAAKLDTYGGWLTGSVPRFEGPQSDSDRLAYTQMAGSVANRSLPADQRLASLEALVKFMDEKAKSYGIPVAGGAPAAQPAPKVGAIEDGHRFKGGDPANPSNWEKVK